MYNIILATNAPLKEIGLKAMIKEVLGENLVFKTVASTARLDEVLNSSDIEFLVLDLITINPHERWALQKMIKRFPTLKILVFYEQMDNNVCRELYKDGILGCLQNNLPLYEIKCAIACAHKGNPYIGKHMLLNIFLAPKKRGTALSALSSKENFIAELLLRGESMIDIGSMMGLHPSTVYYFKKQLFQKLKIRNMIELYDWAQVKAIS